MGFESEPDKKQLSEKNPDPIDRETYEQAPENPSFDTPEEQEFYDLVKRHNDRRYEALTHGMMIGLTKFAMAFWGIEGMKVHLNSEKAEEMEEKYEKTKEGILGRTHLKALSQNEEYDKLAKQIRDAKRILRMPFSKSLEEIIEEFERFKKEKGISSSEK